MENNLSASKDGLPARSVFWQLIAGQNKLNFSAMQSLCDSDRSKAGVHSGVIHQNGFCYSYIMTEFAVLGKWQSGVYFCFSFIFWRRTT